MNETFFLILYKEVFLTSWVNAFLTFEYFKKWNSFQVKKNEILLLQLFE